MMTDEKRKISTTVGATNPSETSDSKPPAIPPTTEANIIASPTVATKNVTIRVDNNAPVSKKSILKAKASTSRKPSESVLEFYGFLQAEERPQKSYNYFSLFRYATVFELFFVLIAIIAGIISGFCIPLMTIEFGILAQKMVIFTMYTLNAGSEHSHEPIGNGIICNPTCVSEGHQKFFGSKTFNNVTNQTIIKNGTAPYCETEFTEHLKNNDPHNVVVSIIKEFSFKSMELAAILTIFSAIYFMALYICANRMIVRLSMEYLESLLRKDMKWYDLRAEKDFGNALIENTQKIRAGIGERLGVCISFSSVFIMAMTLAFYNGWELALIGCVSIPLLVGCTALIASAEVRQLIAEEKSFVKAAHLAEEVFLNISSVFVYGGQKKEFNGFIEQVESKDKSVLKSTILSCVANAFIWISTYMNYALTFYFGTKFALDDQFTEKCDGVRIYTPMSLVCVFFLMMFAALNLGLAFPIFETLLLANHVAKDVLHTIDSGVEVDNLSRDGIKLLDEEIVGNFELQDVYFTYPARTSSRILDGVSFTINHGMTCALVGYSGSGKSSVIKLIAKEYLCDSGFIKLDGIDIRYCNTEWLRSQMAVLSQNVSLFDDTIEENVRMGKVDATLEQIQEACKLANAHEFIMGLKDGYQTIVGFAGSNLSSGQKQRIGLARTLIRHAKILLLDEWSAGLDSKSEQIIQLYLKSTASERTTFIIADKLSTAASADLILVLKDGKIVEKGTHSQLLAAKGVYYELATKVLTKTMNKSAKNKNDRRKSTVAVKLETAQRRPAVLRNADNSVTVAVGRAFGTTKSNLPKIEDIKRRLSSESFSTDSTTTSRITYKINTKGLSPGTVHPIEGSTVISPSTQRQPSSKLKKGKDMWSLYAAREKFSKKEVDIPANKKYRFLTILNLVSNGGIGLISLGMLATILSGGILPIYAILFGFAIGELSQFNIEEAKENTAFYSMFFLFVGITAGLVVFIQHLTLSLGGTRAVNAIRKRLFFAIMRQDMAWFGNPINDITSLNGVLIADAGSAQYIIFTFYGVILECFSSVAIAIVYSLSYGAQRLTLYCFGLIPVVVGASFLDNWFAKRQEIGIEETFYKIAKLVNEVMENKELVANFQLESHFLKKYNKLINGPTFTFLTIARPFAFGFAQSAVFWCYAFCMLFSIREITEHKVPYEEVLITGDNMIFGLLNVGTSLAILPIFNRALDSANRILQIINRKPAMDIDMDGEVVENVKGDVEFNDVSFSYPYAPEIPVLNKVNWSVKAGQMIALIGLSGSGKSSCAQLVLKFYNPTGGVVSIDGKDITTLNCASLLSHMAVVEPDPRLFDRTVAQNIAYGINHREVHISEIIRSAKAANIHTFITSLPEGYDTKVGSSGSLMSAGQKQRILIARVLLRNPSILILDEATAALDHENEEQVLNSLEKARVGRCCIVMSHRLFTIKQADVIVVLDQGNVVESGTHSSLLSFGKVYPTLWESQNPNIS